MHPRYRDHVVTGIWSAQQRTTRWVAIECAHLRVLGCSDAVTSKGPPLHVATAELEANTGHDVGAFLEALELRLVDSEARRKLHYGLTSSDLVDTANAMAINQTNAYLWSLQKGAREALRGIPETLKVQGRTHGQPAAITTVRGRWRYAETTLGTEYGRLPAMFSGAVGQHAILNEKTEYDIASELGMHVCPVSTQVMPRHVFHQALSRWLHLIEVCEQIALDVRLMSMIGECSETRQGVGSTAMPHKVNPIRAEKICGLARVARGLYHAELEGVALWLDRDLTHSSVDRIAFEDMAHLTAHVLEQTRLLLSSLEWRLGWIDADAYTDRLLAVATILLPGPRSETYKLVRQICRDNPSTDGRIRELANAANVDWASVFSVFRGLGNPVAKEEATGSAATPNQTAPTVRIPSSEGVPK